jgi:geranylgeranyl diphosphate synthase type I
LLDEFNRVTIDIVRGQVLDLEFEGRADVTPENYLAMIGGKTAAILRFACWAGATVGGAPEATAASLGAFGEALGIGFQIRDDVLGIWGDRSATGKDPADDIRRRKKSLPILMLFAQAAPEETECLKRLYATEEIGEAGVSGILDLLDAHGIQQQAMAQVAHYHEFAAAALQSAMASYPACSATKLEDLIRDLDARVS